MDVAMRGFQGRLYCLFGRLCHGCSFAMGYVGELYICSSRASREVGDYNTVERTTKGKEPSRLVKIQEQDIYVVLCILQLKYHRKL